MNVTCSKCGKAENLAEPFIEGTCVSCVRMMEGTHAAVKPIVQPIKRLMPIITPTVVGLSLIALSCCVCAIASIIQTVRAAFKYGIGRGYGPEGAEEEWALMGLLLMLFVSGAVVIAIDRLTSTKFPPAGTMIGYGMLLFGSAITLRYLLLYDTTVDGYYNTGLQQNRNLGFAFGSVLCIVGLLVLLITRLKSR